MKRIVQLDRLFPNWDYSFRSYIPLDRRTKEWRRMDALSRSRALLESYFDDETKLSLTKLRSAESAGSERSSGDTFQARLSLPASWQLVDGR